MIRRDLSVTVLTRNTSNLQDFSKANVLQGDLLSLKVEHLIGYDVVIHSAAIKPGNSNESDFRFVNETGTKHLIDICEKASIPKFVHISTMAVNPDRSDIYASSKGIAEQYVKESSIDWIILRIGAVYGLSDFWIDYLRLLRQKRFLFIIGNGEQPLYQIYVKDCAVAITNASLDASVNRQVCCITADPISYNYSLSILKSILKANFIKICVPLWFSRLLSTLLYFLFGTCKPHFVNDPQIDLCLKGTLRLNIYARTFQLGLADMLSDMSTGSSR